MKATHRGHCQACGRLQMLPSGRLSLHGYNVTHGFFSGTCAGAKWEPFEVSCALVKVFITNAQTQLQGVVDFQTSLRAEATAPMAWFNCYEANPRGRYYYTRTHRWKYVRVTEQVIAFRDGTGTYSKFVREGDTKWERVDGQFIVVPDPSEVSTNFRSSLLEVCTEANRVYAQWLEHEAQSLRRYIQWQIDRVANWKPAPLLPVDAKDKEGFEPTAAPY